MNLEEVKSYLKIDFSDDDVYISDLIQISEAYIMFCVGEGYLNDSKGMKISKLLQFKLIKDMYDIRGTEIPSTSKKDTITTTILDILSNI